VNVAAGGEAGGYQRRLSGSRDDLPVLEVLRHRSIADEATITANVHTDQVTQAGQGLETDRLEGAPKHFFTLSLAVSTCTAMPTGVSLNYLPLQSLKYFIPGVAKPQRSKPGYVGHAEQVIELLQGAHRTPFTLCAPPFGALHQPASPSIRRRVTDRAKNRRAVCRNEGAPTQGERGLK
jgi:hypothetical protein